MHTCARLQHCNWRRREVSVRATLALPRSTQTHTSTKSCDRSLRFHKKLSPRVGQRQPSPHAHLWVIQITCLSISLTPTYAPNASLYLNLWLSLFACECVWVACLLNPIGGGAAPATAIAVLLYPIGIDRISRR